MPSSEGSPPSRVSLAIAMDTLVDKLGPDGNGAQGPRTPSRGPTSVDIPPIFVALQAPYTYPGPASAPTVERQGANIARPFVRGQEEASSCQGAALSEWEVTRLVGRILRHFVIFCRPSPSQQIGGPPEPRSRWTGPSTPSDTPTATGLPPTGPGEPGGHVTGEIVRGGRARNSRRPRTGQKRGRLPAGDVE
jgi:hypothetical protein